MRPSVASMRKKSKVILDAGEARNGLLTSFVKR